MIAYNPKDWYKLILSFHKSDTFRMLLPAIIGIGVFAAITVYVGRELLHWDFQGTIAIHSLLGFVISLMLVFRTNTAYDRWWEGRRLWGIFVNHSRSLAVKLSVFVDKEHTAKAQALLINYFFACKEHLRKSMSTKGWVEIPGESIDKYTGASHIPNALLVELTREINSFYKRGLLTDTQFLMLNDELRSYAETMGGCERIKGTPIPYSYSMFIKKIIFFYTITIPFGILTTYHYWTVLIVCFIFYAFASLELLAEEIEDPFGQDANDLPTDEIAEKIKVATREIFKDTGSK